MAALQPYRVEAFGAGVGRGDRAVGSAGVGGSAVSIGRVGDFWDFVRVGL